MGLGALLEHMQELIEACLGILHRLLQLLLLALQGRLLLCQLPFMLLDTDTTMYDQPMYYVAGYRGLLSCSWTHTPQCMCQTGCKLRD